MKRDPRLHQLSSEHHHGLVFVRNLRRGLPPHEIAREIDEVLAPHFLVEERVLLPALMRAGRADLVARALDDHADIRAARNDPAHLADLLEAHIRFEERVMFPACEALGDDVLSCLASLPRP
jgi:hypothetical protein